MRGKKVCYMHGGKSTGPKTKEGIERIRLAHITHGRRTKEAIANQREICRLLGDKRLRVRSVVRLGPPRARDPVTGRFV